MRFPCSGRLFLNFFCLSFLVAELEVLCHCHLVVLAMFCTKPGEFGLSLFYNELAELMPLPVIFFLPSGKFTEVDVACLDK